MEQVENTENNKRKKQIKTVFEVIFFAALTVLGLYYVLKDDPKIIFGYLSKANFFPLTLAIFLSLFAIFLDGISLTILTKIYNPKYKLYQGVINTAIGGFIGCYIKTASTLIQAYTFNKQNVKPAQAASILTMNFLIFQFSLCLYSVIIIVLGYPLMKDIPLDIFFGMKIVWICIFGVIYQVLFLIMTIALGFSKRLHRFVINDVVTFLGKIHLIKDPASTQKRLTLKFVTYRIEMKRMLGNKKAVSLALLFNTLRKFVNGCIPFVIIWSLNTDISNFSFWSSLVAQGYTSLIQSFLTVGAPEIIFQTIYTSILTPISESAASIASAANLIWRFITFYLIFIIGGITFACYRGPKEKRPVIIGNTATIYDLEAIALSENQDSATREFLQAVRYTPSDQRKHHVHEELLTKEELEQSIEKIRQDIHRQQIPEEEIVTDEELEEILEERKKDLAKALQESQEIIDREKPDPEIIAATQAEYQVTEKKQQKRKAREIERLRKRKERNRRKQQKHLEKLQPKGTKISYTDGNINFEGPELIEIKTYTSSDPEEDNQKK